MSHATTTSGVSASSGASDIETLLRRTPVIPVVTLARAADAVPLARALLAGGIDVVEITFRSDAAAGGIAAIRRDCAAMTVGAGTVWTAEQAAEAASAGAQFLVSPGIADTVHDAAEARRIPYLPGSQTASEVAHLVRRGARAVKFFPAAAAGGPAAVTALAAVFPNVLFCPTGGVDEGNAAEYLRLSCVPCVGGSWLAPAEVVKAARWADIEALARRAASLAAMHAAPAGPS